MADGQAQLTPMMRQYFDIKSRYPDKDTILFFRLGDFYEMFFEDAETASGILDIALTSRNKNSEDSVPLCGVPFHAADQYIAKLLANGKKVAICEQMEDPTLAKGLVKRDVIRVITPGTVLEPEGLESERHNFLAAVNEQGGKFGFAYIDVTTGLFKATEFASKKDLLDELARIEPSEVLVSRSLAEAKDWMPDQVRHDKLFNTSVTILDDPQFDPTKFSAEKIPDVAKASAGAILHYVSYAAKEVLKHIRKVEGYTTSSYMVVDESTKRNLELTRTMIDGNRHGSLLWLIDQTTTPMGARLIREWMLHPLTSPAEISRRHDAIDELIKTYSTAEVVIGHLKKISDIERMAGRIAMETANARDLVALKNSLKEIKDLAEIKTNTELLKEILSNIDPLETVAEEINMAIDDEPPLGIKDGGLIKPGFSAELDELREISRSAKGFIARIEEDERTRTGVSSLKVRYNRVFGYYIEITNSHKDKIPANYIRKQTLANAERFITEELKTFEEKVLGAEEKIKALEYELFRNLRSKLGENVASIKKTAESVAELDSLVSLATVARTNRYVRPTIDDGGDISIKDGRHPIIEKILSDHRFVPNDCLLNGQGDRLLIITGPNMAGKSTVMRQVALIVLMAQMGSFVPAAEARIGIVDRIFTRVGASDNIMRGQSTFMVEMQEASDILKEATEKSLIIIDEIGRGTSTFDGVAIAWAVAEYIHDRVKAKTLFATHYHELVELAITKKHVKNFNIAVKEWNDKIIFLHKLVPGGVNHSYGIQVASLAGLPSPVVERAKEILANLERGELDEIGQPRIAQSKREGTEKKLPQLQLFHTSDENEKIVQEIKSANLDAMTPIESLNFLHTLKKLV